jgi:hypothetical protein
MQPYARFADIIGFLLAQLMSDFAVVADEHIVRCCYSTVVCLSLLPTNRFFNPITSYQPTFISLLDEALAMHVSLGLYQPFPLQPVAFGVKAMLAHRSGDIERFVDLATEALVATKCVSSPQPPL